MREREKGDISAEVQNPARAVPVSLKKSWLGIPCSLSTWALLHRHESHTWSLERTESLTSDSQSGIMLSSVGTSKCNSPACVEARARRGATFCIEDQRRPTTQYRDSVDSLRDSPHSERSDPAAWCHHSTAEASHASVPSPKTFAFAMAELAIATLVRAAASSESWWQCRFGAQG